MKSKNNRIEHLDILKGIGIILVVWGHIQSDLTQYIFIFHMPLFFFISGLLYKPTDNFFPLLKKRINTLLIPFFFFYLLAFFYLLLLSFINPNTNFNSIILLDFIKGKEYFHNIPIWFLWSLFCVNLFYWIITHFFKKTYVQDVFILIISLFCIWLGYQKINIPYFIDTSLSVLLFFHLGYRLRKVPKIMTKNKYDTYISSFCLFLFLLLIYIYPVPCDIRENLIKGNFFFFIAECLAAIFGLLYLSKCLSHSKILTFYGKNSLIIVGTHLIILGIITYIESSYSITFLSIFYGLPILIIILVFSIPVIWILNKYFPFFVSKKRVLF
ncbi:acyltransferase family protein [Bacteroidales bacterium OttesenSCG-928-J19]|nr:acyltransferase family protein [Bacteroidales bacterium OttesenSCG-928-J19]